MDPIILKSTTIYILFLTLLSTTLPTQPTPTTKTPLNLVFAKHAIAWTFIPTLPLLLYFPRRHGMRIAAYITWWIINTKILFVHVNSITSTCTLDYGEKKTCLESGGEWNDGWDISGHVL